MLGRETVQPPGVLEAKRSNSLCLLGAAVPSWTGKSHMCQSMVTRTGTSRSSDPRTCASGSRPSG
eukprot:223872-Karenia_brevis.AAC.1